MIAKRKRMILALAALAGLILVGQVAAWMIAPGRPLTTVMLLVPLALAPIVLLMAWRRLAAAEGQTPSAAAVTVDRVTTMLWLILAALLVSALSTIVRFAGY